MIVGLGIDLVELSRIRRSLERFGDHFLRKILHPSEMAGLPMPIAPDQDHPAIPEPTVAFAAARFAAKEAGAKALGTGFTNGIGLHDIRITSLPSGKPVISFHGPAREAARALGAASAHLSLTHARETAGAVVVLEGGVAGEEMGKGRGNF